jgi:hypothetical protein
MYSPNRDVIVSNLCAAWVELIEGTPSLTFRPELTSRQEELYSARTLDCRNNFNSCHRLPLR